MKTSTEAVEEVVAIHEEALRLQREADAALVEAGHAEVLAAMRLGEKDCWMPTAVAQRIVDLLAAKIRSGG